MSDSFNNLTAAISDLEAAVQANTLEIAKVPTGGSVPPAGATDAQLDTFTAQVNQAKSQINVNTQTVETALNPVLPAA